MVLRGKKLTVGPFPQRLPQIHKVDRAASIFQIISTHLISCSSLDSEKSELAPLFIDEENKVCLG